MPREPESVPSRRGRTSGRRSDPYPGRAWFGVAGLFLAGAVVLSWTMAPMLFAAVTRVLDPASATATVTAERLVTLPATMTAVEREVREVRAEFDHAGDRHAVWLRDSDTPVGGVLTVHFTAGDPTDADTVAPWPRLWGSLVVLPVPALLLYWGLRASAHRRRGGAPRAVSDGPA
ncbi:hypothetical protein LX16_0748 [Stackebrandtia albiflava]|uniref:DUF3592 domain-containing protein n=1 Tax=Stackebrandtia albiflava TaxID=406432 RepID=A0A562VAY8_9ACTN|nr:hypothetical protein [Stackebrandtia albiflava]TWJ15050.1 hypothetical protein LX16_0748 [Stackebrandtia albiflava]